VPLPLVLSARSELALRGVAGPLAACLRADPVLGLADVAFAVAAGRARLEHRVVVVGGDRETLLTGLDAVVAGAPTAEVRGVAMGAPPDLPAPHAGACRAS
jgi:acyl transferase domain-containing protein